MSTCVICHKEFTAKRSDAKYCGKECARKGDKLLGPISQCEQCGKDFHADKPGRKYCSHKCYTDANVGHPAYNPKRRVTKACVVCGTEFETGGRAGGASKAFCSWECRYKGRYRKGKQANALSATDAAYIAGFMDGEGSIMIQPKWNAYSIRISAVNTDHEVMQWIVSATGIGRIYHRKRTNSSHSDTWWWQCASESAESILSQIRPYLRIKAKHADIALEFQERLRNPALKADQSWQVEMFEHVKALNRRGPQPQEMED